MRALIDLFFKGSYASNSLMVVSIPIVDYARCNFSYAGYISDSMICASDYEVGGKDACQVRKYMIYIEMENNVKKKCY